MMKSSNCLRILNLFLFLLTAGFTSGQQTGFFLKTDRSDIHEGETFVLEATLENLDGQNIKMPDLAPFEVIQGPSTARSMSVVNGKRTFSLSYKFLLRASKKGSFEISPATCQMGNKLLKTNSLKISVTGKKNTASAENPGDKPTFIRLELSDNPAYPGQQTVLDYVIYTSQNLESCSVDNQPKNPGFFSRDVDDIRDQPQRIQIKGREYYTQVVKRVLLFPQKTGEFEMEPTVFSITVPEDNGNSGFFFRNVRRERITTDPLRIRVNKLPENAPASFNGSVGDFTFKSEVKKPAVARGESVKMQVEIKGDGDPNLMKAPEIRLPDGFEKYEPSVVYENSYLEGKKLITVKQFEYLFVPQSEGTFSVVPEFSYFSAAQGKYITQFADTIRISVLPSTAAGQRSPQEEGTPAPMEISGDTSLTDINNGMLGSPLFWSLLALILASTGAGLYIRKRRTEQAATPGNAGRHAKSVMALSAAKELFVKGDLPSYYELLNETTTGYLMEKYSIPHEDSGPEGIIGHLRSHGAGEEAIALYREIRQKCELARFAGTFDSDASLHEKAVRLINMLESK